MANLPAIRSQSSVSDAYAEQIGELISQGQHVRDIARRLHPDDPVARRRTYKRLRRLALTDPRVAQYIADDSRLDLMAGLRPTVNHLLRHARRRPDAAKLVLEASGFHNPRVQHEHSGEIEVKLTMPRPKHFDQPEQIADAEVVEDETSS